MGHNIIIDEYIAPTCYSSGLSQGSHCDRCLTVFEQQEYLDKLSHNEVIVEAIKPTCESSGYSQGIKCDVCNDGL